MTRVAMIGLGRMGGPMARHMIDAGHEVSLFDVDPTRLALFEDSPARIASSPADAASSADVVCIVVFDDQQTIEVITGDEGVLRSLEPGSVVAIHSTISHATLRLLDGSARAREVALLDAGISGGETGADAGTLLTMVGGADAALERASSALESFSKEIIHAGDLGTGLALKLARNATGYICMAAIHEAMVVANASGIPLETLKHTISETGVFDQALSPFLLGGPEPLPIDAPESMRDLLTHLRSLGEKDLDQVLALAVELDEPLAVARATRQTFHSVTRL